MLFNFQAMWFEVSFMSVTWITAWNCNDKQNFNLFMFCSGTEIKCEYTHVCTGMSIVLGCFATAVVMAAESWNVTTTHCHPIITNTQSIALHLILVQQVSYRDLRVFFLEIWLLYFENEFFEYTLQFKTLESIIIFSVEGSLLCSP